MISFSVPVRSPGRKRRPADPPDQPGAAPGGAAEEPGEAAGGLGEGPGQAAGGGEPGRPPRGLREGVGRHARTALAAWAGIILAGFAVGAVLRAAGYLPVDRFPPLHASPRLLLGPLLPAAALALVAVAVLPVAARRLPWGALLAVAWLGSVLWAVVLQLPDGLARPLTAPTEYLAGLPAVGDDPLRWLRGFARDMQAYPTHVKGHPPLPTLILWALRSAGLRDAGWAAALVIVAGGSASAAIAVTVRRLAGAETARRAVPFLVLAPTALWVATSVDALFLGVAAWAVALLTVAAAPLPARSAEPPAARSAVPSSAASSAGALAGRWRVVAAAFAGGLLLGSLPYLSYGLLPVFALPLAVLLLTRPPRPVLGALAAGCLVVPVAFTLAGFSWFAGVAGTHAAWAAGGGARARPYAYFLLGDLSVLALLIGPATAMALPAVLGRVVPLARAMARRAAPVGGGRLGLPVAAALIGMAALDLSGVTRGEVERIWIPYAAWTTIACAVHRPPARTLLLAQAVTALTVQALVRSPW
ncbi:hypothetical protein [Actinoallomurus rhizosphaericola]|uniref:hypothetical protein n=1 Tax=Actinoallomurus rhizosphaericola TaxID=2952536 RepID=UPI00209182A2|nr:hypothetical protein [Actinoallomurus rhizosphaericola]MCO5992935.1 hypothetical protein [Actinoallomurus rhizosphaericola]